MAPRLSTDWLRAPLQALIRYPARSALTVLGLSIGVAAFIAMISFGEGARRSVLTQFEALGTNVLIVRTFLGDRAARGQPIQPLTDADLGALRRGGTTFAAVVPVASKAADVSRGADHHWATIIGTTERYPELHDWLLTAGGMFDATDVDQKARVCVIGATPARALFGDEDPLGEPLTLDGALPCRVIGVLAAKGYSTGGNDIDNVALVPVSTYASHIDAGGVYGQLEVRPARPDLLGAARIEATEILRGAHGIEPGQGDDFRVTSPMDVVRAAQQTSDILTGLLQAIAAVSLLVGGIGIMNIQLVSVAERTKEIGIRSAIGAPPRAILTQFLLEALALAVVGALLGIGLGLAISAVTARLMHWPQVISALGTLAAAAFAIAVGLLFGSLPARRASRLDPVEALRRE